MNLEKTWSVFGEGMWRPWGRTVGCVDGQTMKLVRRNQSRCPRPCEIEGGVLR